MKSQKIAEQVFRGIHFIKLSDLPEDQAAGLKEELESDQVIKIMINNEIIPDCVQYCHYEQWFDNVYSVAMNGQETPNESKKSQSQPISNVLRPSTSL